MPRSQKYITDIKELPDNEEVEDVKTEMKSPVKTMQKMEAPEENTEKLKAGVFKPQEEIKDYSKSTLEEKESEDVQKTEEKMEETPAEKMEKSDVKVDKTDLRIFSTKDVILGAINILSIVFLIFLLTQISAKSKSINSLKSEERLTMIGGPIDNTEIEEYMKKSDQLEGLFVDESGVVEFVGEVDKLKSTGHVVNLSFTSQKPVKDLTGNVGLPIIIELRGDSLDELLPALGKIKDLPYLIRPISIKVRPLDEEIREGKNITVVEYGVLLYVNEKLYKN